MCPVYTQTWAVRSWSWPLPSFTIPPAASFHHQHLPRSFLSLLLPGSLSLATHLF